MLQLSIQHVGTWTATEMLYMVEGKEVEPWFIVYLFHRHRLHIQVQVVAQIVYDRKMNNISLQDIVVLNLQQIPV